VVPISASWPKDLRPYDVRKIVAYVASCRTDPKPFDVVIAGTTPPNLKEGAEIVQPYVEAGATWWSESINGMRGSFKEMRKRVCKGPPIV